MATTTVKPTHFYQPFSDTLRTLKEGKEAFISGKKSNDDCYTIAASLDKNNLLITLMIGFFSNTPADHDEIACKKKEIINLTLSTPTNYAI